MILNDYEKNKISNCKYYYYYYYSFILYILQQTKLSKMNINIQIENLEISKECTDSILILDSQYRKHLKEFIIKKGFFIVSIFILILYTSYFFINTNIYISLFLSITYLVLDFNLLSKTFVLSFDKHAFAKSEKYIPNDIKKKNKLIFSRFEK